MTSKTKTDEKTNAIACPPCPQCGNPCNADCHDWKAAGYAKDPHYGVTLHHHQGDHQCRKSWSTPQAITTQGGGA